MTWENYEIYLSQVVKIQLHFRTYVEKILKFTFLKWLKNPFKLSTMVKEIFKIYSS